MTVKIENSLVLPSGSRLKNRIAKSAMSERLGTYDHKVTEKMITLYRSWAQGGTGLLITGNVMIDSNAIGEPNNVVIEDDSDMEMLKKWAKAGQENGTQIWMQLNHPGKQTPKFLTKEPVAPSATPLNKSLARYFNAPRALTENEILDLISRYANTSLIAKQAGFEGVQIHGAHGYLVSQFLSPNHNKRTDKWGGSLENRMRFVIEVYKAIRDKVGTNFNVGIKMNSADFQRGGFTEEESMKVAETLSDLGMDLIEISGGTYESPEMAHGDGKKSTREREAYFLDYAEKVRGLVSAPLMVTGGFRSTTGMNAALESAAMDVVGIARVLAVDPDFSNKALAGNVSSTVQPIKTGIKMVDKMALMEVSWYTRQIHRIASGKSPVSNESGFIALLKVLVETSYSSMKTKRVRA